MILKICCPLDLNLIQIIIKNYIPNKGSITMGLNCYHSWGKVDTSHISRVNSNKSKNINGTSLLPAIV